MRNPARPGSFTHTLLQMDTTYVKIKDPAGSYNLQEQGISIFAAKPAKVERTEKVSELIDNGVLIEISEKEYNNIVKEVEKVSQISEEMKTKEKETNNLAETVTDLVNDAIDAKIITKDGNQYVYGSNKAKLGTSLEAVVNKLVGNENLREKVTKDIVEHKAKAQNGGNQE